MIEDAKKMSCGNCGAQKFFIYQIGGSNTRPDKLVFECLKCESTSVIKTMQPQLEISFGEKSEGVICIL